MTTTEAQKLASKRWYDKNKDIIKQKRLGNRHEEHVKYYQKNK